MAGTRGLERGGSFYEHDDRARAQAWIGWDTSASAVQLRSSTDENGLECVPLCRVDGKPVFELHLDHAFADPGGMVDPSTLLTAVDSRIGDREVVEVAGDVPSPIVGEPTVVSLSTRYGVLDIVCTRRDTPCTGPTQGLLASPVRLSPPLVKTPRCTLRVSCHKRRQLVTFDAATSARPPRLLGCPP